MSTKDENKLTILIVDDERVTVAILTKMLAPYASTILAASDGIEGLELFKNRRPDLVLSDVNMPRMGGLEMVQAIREIDEHVKIALITNFENRDTLIKAIQFGVNQFFSKPFEAKYFTQIISHLRDDILEKRRIRAELTRQQNILQAINQMSQNFLQSNDWMTALDGEMKRLKNAARSSSVFIYQNETEGNALTSQRLLALNDTPNSVAKKRIHFKKDHLMRWKRRLEKGEAINGNLDQYDRSKQKLLEAFNIDSLLILPIFADHKWWGFLGIGNNNKETFNAANVAMLGTAASIIGAAITSKHNFQSLEMSSTVFEHTMDGVLITDKENRILRINDSFTTITGYKLKDVLGKDPKLLKSGVHDKFFYQQIWDSISKSGYWQGEITNRKKNGEIYIEWLSINAVKNTNGEIENHIGIFSDVTHRREDIQKYTYLATHDPLTGLSNRLLFDDRLNQAIFHAERFDKCFAVIFCDLDKFKPINDTYGHSIGDQLLKMVAQSIQNILRKEDTVCRFGGDEFVILVEDIKEIAALQTILQKLSDIQFNKIQIDELELSVGISIGVSIYPQDATTADELLKNADEAMYKAKRELGNNIAYFHPINAPYCKNNYSTRIT